MLTENDLNKLMRGTPNLKVQYLDNITPEFIELPYTSTAAKEAAVCPAGNDSQHDQQSQTHHSMTLDSQHRLQARLDKLERPLLERNYEPWYPFPSCAVTSHRRLYREQEFPSQAADHMGRAQALRKFDEYKSQKLEESVQAKKSRQPRDVPQAILKSILNAHAQADFNRLLERTGVSVQRKLNDRHQAKENTGDAAVKSSRNLNRGLQRRKYLTQRPHMSRRRPSKQIPSRRSKAHQQDANEVPLSLDSVAVSSGPASLPNLDFATARMKLRQQSELAVACTLPHPESPSHAPAQSVSLLSSALSKLSIEHSRDISKWPRQLCLL